jgi:ABC-type sugar transport system substrate-binding protein
MRRRGSRQMESNMNYLARRRALTGAGALLAGALALSACNNGGAAGTNATGTGPAPATGGTKRLGATIPTFNHPFFVAMKKGLDEEAKAQGAEINVVDGKTTPRHRSPR